MYVCPKCLEENPRLGAQCPRDGAYFVPQSALQDAKNNPLIGTMMADKFIITSLISEGGMGAVYRALQMPVEREIAFKVLLTELQDSDKGRDRFRQEARAISKLQHPNIITMFDFGFSETGHPYMAMEYAPGVSLAQWNQTPGITTERVLHVFEQILAALSEAHRQGIIHRDLKPDNMIITRAGEDMDFVKLLDFGIARITNENATRGLTREGEVFGTPHYMAPEQAQGKKNVGPQADVYAIGIMFYEMLCGEAPFDAESPLAVLFMHINEPLPPMKPRPGLSIPKVIEDIILRATQKDPEDRFADASQMLQALYESVGRTTGAFSSTTLQQSAIIATTAPRTNTPNTPIAPPEPVVNLEPFDPLANQRTSVFDGKSIATSPPTKSSQNNKTFGLILAFIALLVVMIGGAFVFLMAPSDDAVSAKESPEQETLETPGTISANVEIPIIELKPDPEPDALEKPEEKANNDAPEPSEVTDNKDTLDTPPPKKDPPSLPDNVQKQPKTRQKTASTVNKRPTKASPPKKPEDKKEPVKFSPPKFKAPEDIPMKFERPK